MLCSGLLPRARIRERRWRPARRRRDRVSWRARGRRGCDGRLRRRRGDGCGRRPRRWRDRRAWRRRAGRGSWAGCGRAGPGPRCDASPVARAGARGGAVRFGGRASGRGRRSTARRRGGRNGPSAERSSANRAATWVWSYRGCGYRPSAAPSGRDAPERRRAARSGGRAAASSGRGRRRLRPCPCGLARVAEGQDEEPWSAGTCPSRRRGPSVLRRSRLCPCSPGALVMTTRASTAGCCRTDETKRRTLA